MTKVAIYARVSTGEQAERQTIQAQLHDCRAFAAQKGWEVVGEFPDDGVSGTVPFHEREQGAALLAVLEARAADTILINYADRLARDQLEGVMAYNRLQKLAAVEFVSGSFDDTPEGKFTLQVLLSVAELERQLIRRRTSKGRRRRTEGGKWNGGYAPYGYDYVAGSGELSVNEAEAEVVRRIYRQYSGGVSMHEVGRQLNAEGVATKRGGKGWWRVQLWWLLKNPAYKGEALVGRSHMGQALARDEWVKMAVPAIVSTRMWNAVQARLAQNNKWAARPKDGVSKYLLGGVAYCQHCGRKLRAHTQRRSHVALKTGEVREAYRYYKCDEAERLGEAHIVNRCLAAERVEGPVVDAIVATFSDPAVVLEAVRAYAGVVAAAREGNEDAVMADLHRNIAAAEAERERAVTLHVKGTISEAQLNKQLARIEGSLRDWGSTLAQMEAAAHARAGQAELEAQAFQIAASIRQIFESEPFERQREWVRTLVDKVWIDPKGNVHIDALVPGLLPYVGVSVKEQLLANSHLSRQIRPRD